MTHVLDLELVITRGTLAANAPSAHRRGEGI